MPLPVCRVCLSSNILTVHSVTDIHLRDIYEKLTGTQLRSEDNLPETLCFYCCWQLQQFCNLTATALYSDKMLRKVLDCDTKTGLRYIHSLPKSRHLSFNTLKSFSFNGKSNEITFEYPRQMMLKEKNQPKLVSLTNVIREKPDDITTIPITKTLLSTKSIKKTPVMKQYGAIAEQPSLQCLLTDKPGLVITKQKKPLATSKTGIGEQETQKNETKHKTEELHFKTQSLRQEKQDLDNGFLNNTKKHEINLTQAFDDNSQSEDTSQASAMDKTISEKKPPIFFFCDICEKLFQTFENLSEHQKTHKIRKKTSKKGIRVRVPTPCPICNKYVMDMSSHKIVHSERRYFCDICGHISRSKGNLVTHMRVHTDEPQVVCKICNKGFKSKRSFIYHKYVHTGERPFSCHICGGKYKQNCQVRAHIRFVHEGFKPFCCDICGKRFIKTDKLLDHLNAHANIKPFSCNQCHKVFRTASANRRHVAKYCKGAIQRTGGVAPGE